MVEATCSVTNGCRHKIVFILHSGLGSEDQEGKGMKATIMNLSVHACPPPRGVEEQSDECEPHSVFRQVFGPEGCKLKAVWLSG